MNTALVCGAGPPGNANAGLANRRREKLIDVPETYHGPGFVQSGIVWKRWSREAARLFAEYWKTGNPKHLFAFTTHVHGMRNYDRRRS
jgi:hypothetical protein